MHVARPLSHLARTGLAVAVAATALSLAPLISESASAAPAGVTVASTDSAECTAARTALAQARSQQRAARLALVKARKALRKAKASHKSAKIHRAARVVKRATKRYRARIGVTHARGARMSYACAAPTSAAKANATGKKLALLALADGLPLDLIGLDQLTALLDRFLPGLSGDLTSGQLTALLDGFNAIAGAGADPADVLALLGGAFDTDEITSILGSAAGPELLGLLAENILGGLGGLGGGLPLPGDFDPTEVLDTFAGLFGSLDPTQFGDLLVLLTRATGTSGSTFSLDQLTGLIGSLAPGALDAFSPADLTTMLAVLNGHAVSESVLSNILGGQFSVAQLSSVMGGTAPADLVGAVFAQVMAQFATGGDGGLSLPGDLDLTQLTDLVSTLTDLITGLLGGGGGLLGGICDLLPLPGLCP
jgi:hypothetical protein